MICKPLSKISGSTFPYKDFTPTLPASICLNIDEKIPNAINKKPTIFKEFENLEKGFGLFFKEKLNNNRITPKIINTIIIHLI
jgi:hypothetical protein